MSIPAIFSLVVITLILAWLGKTVFLTFLILFAGLISFMDTWWAIPTSIVLMLIVIFSFGIDEI